MATKAEAIAKLEGMLAELDDALASGVKSVFGDGERTEYQSTQDMLTARREIVRQLQGLRTGGRRPRFRIYRYLPTMRF